MNMDRTEQTGLVTAVVIHGLLAGAIWIGMQSRPETAPPQASINVSLIGDTGPVSTAPDAIQEEPAPSADIMEDPAPLAQAAPEAPTIPVVTPTLPKKVTPTPVKKIVSPPEKTITPKTTKAKTPAKTVAPKTAPAKSTTSKSTAAKTSASSAAKKSGGLGKGFEDTIAGIGGSDKSSASKSNGAGTAAGTPASKSGAEVRRSVNTALANQIRPYIRSCAPSGVDIDEIRTFITLNLARDGSLNSVRFDRQSGINDSNRPQAGPLKDCALKAAQQASPYKGLDPEYHDVWKSHKLQLKAR